MREIKVICDSTERGNCRQFITISPQHASLVDTILNQKGWLSHDPSYGKDCCPQCFQARNTRLIEEKKKQAATQEQKGAV